MKLTDKINEFRQQLNSIKFTTLKQDIMRLSEPLIEKWNQRTSRERNLLSALLAVLCLFIISSIIHFMISLSSEVKTNNTKLQAINALARNISQEYSEVNKIPPNQFSQATKDSITQDMQQILKVKEPNISLDNGVLSISAQNVTFNNATLFMEQLRNSYALFPQKLTITRTITSGYVTLNATFLVNNNAN